MANVKHQPSFLSLADAIYFMATAEVSPGPLNVVVSIAK